MSSAQETALNSVKQRFDEIYDIVDNVGISFIEVLGRIGGDRAVFRVYTDGTVTER